MGTFLSGVQWYGVIIALAMVAGIALAWFCARYRGYNPDVVFDIAIWAIPCAIVGARLNFALSEALSDRPMTFLEIIGFQNGEFVGLSGLSIMGGIVGGVIGVLCNALIYKKKGRKETFLHMADIAAPFLLLGQAIGRWGNFANQELYGQAVTNPSMQWFPFAVYIDAEQGWFQALFFYEFVLNLIGAALLLWIWLGKRRSHKGMVAAFYFMWYGIIRTFLEGLRQPEFIMYWFDVIPISQAQALLTALAGVAIMIFIIARARKKEKLVPLFVTREDWGRTGLDDFDWGRDPSVPLPPIFKKKAAAQEEADEPEAEDAPIEADEPEAEDAPIEAEQKADEAEEPADGFERKKYAGKED